MCEIGDHTEQFMFSKPSYTVRFFNNPGWSPRPGALSLGCSFAFIIFAEEAKYKLAQNVQT